jgi:tetratricopeptide (TPR) repeat protein
VYAETEDYSKALEFFKKSLKIREKALPPNHPDLATSYNNIGMTYCNKNDYSKALTFLEKAITIWQTSLPPNHPDIETAKNYIEIIKVTM